MKQVKKGFVLMRRGHNCERAWSRLLLRFLPLMLVMGLVVLMTAGVMILAGRTKPEPDDKIGVVVSVEPQAQVVERVGGERVKVTVMIPPGKSPATYSPSPDGMKRLAEAKLYFKVGHPLFPFEKNHFDRLIRANKEIRVVDGAQGVELLPDDPHLWLSPSVVAVHVSALRDALIELDPAGREEYEENARRFAEEISGLSAEFMERFEKHSSRKFFVYHPAWGYFAREFGIVQRSLEKDFKSPGPGDIERFLKEAEKENTRTIFVQQQYDRRHAEMAAEFINGRVVSLDPLARDWLNNLKYVGREIEKALK